MLCKINSMKSAEPRFFYKFWHMWHCVREIYYYFRITVLYNESVLAGNILHQKQFKEVPYVVVHYDSLQ